VLLAPQVIYPETGFCAFREFPETGLSALRVMNVSQNLRADNNLSKKVKTDDFFLLKQQRFVFARIDIFQLLT
jgi:hypothetical protein